MINVSNDFKLAMKQPVKELQAYISAGDVKLTDADDLISFKISCDTGICKSAMRKLEATYLGETNLLGQWVRVAFGVKLSDGTFEYLDYGSFLISEITYSKDKGTTDITGYDKMINSMKSYTKLDIEYPVALLDYTRALCEACGLELGNETLNTLNDWSITQELWENIDGITYRDIFQQIAQVTATVCMIGNNDKIYFKPLTDTSETLTYDNLFKLKLEPIYGEINHVTIGRDPVVGEDVFLKDDESIGTYGDTEYRISNNEIVDKDRENAIEPIFNAFKGISYYPFELTTEGLGWYEIGDSFNIVNDLGDVFNTSLFNFTITVAGSLKETLKAVAETKTQSQYQYASSISKRIKNTEIIVNKQEGTIQSLVKDVQEEDGIVNSKFTEIYQDIDNIINSVQNSGGSNLIKNSVMFAYDSENKPSNWDISGDGTLTIGANAEALNSGGLSGHSFTLVNKTASQKVAVSTDLTYTFSTRIKKNTTGNCYVKIYNSNEEYKIEIPSGTNAFYTEYELKDLQPKDNYYIIEFYGSADSDATFTDNMLAIGDLKKQWTQANGEIMNTQVNFNVDGILVKSSVYLGDYTIMSPLEFAGYSNINGTITKVFSLNKDVTFVKKLEADDEIKMVPIKIVPVTSGDLLGWAFVPST
jgi:hypothetical protein